MPGMKAMKVMKVMQGMKVGGARVGKGDRKMPKDYTGEIQTYKELIHTHKEDT